MKDQSEVGFGLTTFKNYTVGKHEELFITYGERANSFLLIEYGFAIKNNRYDYLRVKNIDIPSLIKEHKLDLSPKIREDFEEKLDDLNLKSELQADLKTASLHRDVLKLLRAYVQASQPDDTWDKQEKVCLQHYKEWIETQI